MSLSGMVISVSKRPLKGMGMKGGGDSKDNEESDAGANEEMRESMLDEAFRALKNDDPAAFKRAMYEAICITVEGHVKSDALADDPPEDY